MELFIHFMFFCVGASLSRISQFFLDEVARNTDLFHVAIADSLRWSVQRDLSLIAVQNIILAGSLALGFAFLIRKLISSKITSARTQEFAVLAGVVIGAWFWPN
jgi:hypothetical protein